jgi:hypothetical protein
MKLLYVVINALMSITSGNDATGVKLSTRCDKLIFFMFTVSNAPILLLLDGEDVVVVVIAVVEVAVVAAAVVGVDSPIAVVIVVFVVVFIVVFVVFVVLVVVAVNVGDCGGGCEETVCDAVESLAVKGNEVVCSTREAIAVGN